MRFRCFITIIFCFFAALDVSGQQLLTIHGVVSRKLSADRVSQVLIRNLRNDDLMMSDELGWFTVKAAVGDTLLFTKADYTDQKVVISNGSDLPVYMQPVIKLETVTIMGQTEKQELKDVMADYRKQGVFNNGNSLPVLSFLTSPITGLYNLFGSSPGRARRFAAYSKEELEAAEVHKRYTLKLVKQVTNAPDSVAKKFMYYYTPTYDDLKVWNDYELIQRIKRSYEYYSANRERLDLQDLTFPAQKPEKQEDQ